MNGLMYKAYCCIIVFAVIVAKINTTYGLTLFLLLFLHVWYTHGDFWYRSYLTLGRDLCGMYNLLRMLSVEKYGMFKNQGIHKCFMKHVAKYPNKTAIIDIELQKEFSFRHLNCEMNKYANYFKSLGYKSGDVVALYMENSANFAIVWMGLAKIGVITAWINTNLKLQPFAHCINISKAKSIITSVQLSKNVSECKNQKLIEKIDVFTLGDSNQCESVNLNDILNDVSTDEPSSINDTDVTFKSVLCFIYTSGTTGLPKAAVIKHFRYHLMVKGTSYFLNISKDDRIYLAMPLYHTAAGIIGIGQAIINGASVVIRKKFSASNFWKDCVKYDCTVSLYIGEICRYLLAQPECSEEKMHKLRLMYGNGLRSEIWQDFVDRFNVRIGEVYGSTEGNTSLVNLDEKVGACGFLPISPLAKLLHPVSLIKVDETTGEIIMGEDGFCIACQPGETGLLISAIHEGSPLLAFEGYLNKTETKKKVLRNAFKKGDGVYISGDILHWDKLGYIYFRDRMGDTFRWKGENVSTTEVEGILLPLKCCADAVVYGVIVPGHEGRAGMASVVKLNDFIDDEKFLDEICHSMLQKLPIYAVPVFVRICKSVEKTGTYKLIKTDLQALGYKATPESGNVYFKTTKCNKYVELDPHSMALLESGQLPGL